MKNIFRSLLPHLQRFTHPSAQDEPLGELLYVREAHTIVPWKVKYAKAPALRQPRLGDDPLAAASPWPRQQIVVGCVTRTMRKIAAEARQEVQDFSELAPIHARTQLQSPLIVDQATRSQPVPWARWVCGVAVVSYLVLVNML